MKRVCQLEVNDVFIYYGREVIVTRIENGFIYFMGGKTSANSQQWVEYLGKQLKQAI